MNELKVNESLERIKISITSVLVAFLSAVAAKLRLCERPSSDCNPMTWTHNLKDKTVNLAYRMYFECPVVLKKHFSPVSSVIVFNHQISVLARQRLLLVTEKMFVDDYFSSSSSLTKLTLVDDEICKAFTI